MNELNEVSEQLQDTEQQLQETQVALLSKDKTLHALKRQLADVQRAGEANGESRNDGNAAALAEAMRRVQELESTNASLRQQAAAAARNSDDFVPRQQFDQLRQQHVC